MNSLKKAIIFDFDGTIADSMQIFIDTTKIITKTDKIFNKKEIDEIRNLTIPEVLVRLGIKKWQIPNLLISGKKEMDKRIGDAKPYDGIINVIQELNKHYSLYILSGNSKRNINSFLKKYELSDQFVNIYGSISIWGKSAGLKKLCRKIGVSPNKCIYIGDEIRDLEASKKVNINFISVSWGFNSKEILLKLSPQFIVDSPKDIIQKVNLIFNQK